MWLKKFYKYITDADNDIIHLHSIHQEWSSLDLPDYSTTYSMH